MKSHSLALALAQTHFPPNPSSLFCHHLGTPSHRTHSKRKETINKNTRGYE